MRKRQVPEEKKNILQKSDEKKKPKPRIIFSKYKLIFLVFFILYFTFPLSVYLLPFVRHKIVFQNYVRLSPANLSFPSESGLECARNFYVTSPNNVKLGVWHIPPKSLQMKCKEGTIAPDIEFSDQKPVILYLHGTVGDRAAPNRVSLYKILSEQVDVHVIAYDYRGYGDSSSISPTEGGLAEDTEVIFDWISKRVNSSLIFVWGHSLGTGVGTAFLQKIVGFSSQPGALILESPFTKIIEAVRQHPLTVFYRYMPFFDFLVANPIDSEETGFNNLVKIRHIKCPLLILHAEDDVIAPFEHGEILYQEALETREKMSSHITMFIGFEAKLGLGHNKIFENSDLPNIVKAFIISVLKLRF